MNNGNGKRYFILYGRDLPPGTSHVCIDSNVKNVRAAIRRKCHIQGNSWGFIEVSKADSPAEKATVVKLANRLLNTRHINDGTSIYQLKTILGEGGLGISIFRN